MKASRIQGFTLIEVLMAMVIIALLTAVALPSYQNQVTRSRRSDCMSVVMAFSQAMERFYSENYTYLGTGVSGADTGAPEVTTFPNQCPIDGTALYNLTIQAAAAQSFTLRATPASGSSQVGDGIIEVNSLGQRFWDKNNEGDTNDSNENNWDT